MAHTYPPNDPERLDWDRRDAELRHRIGELERELAELQARNLVIEEAARTQLGRAETAEAEVATLREQLKLYEEQLNA